MNELDHEKNALVQMLQEAFGREIQLRAALSRVQMELNAAQVTIKNLTEPPAG